MLSKCTTLKVLMTYFKIILAKLNYIDWIVITNNNNNNNN